MSQHDLEIRMEFLEHAVAGLAGLPQQVLELATQFPQLREDVRTEISRVKRDVGELRGEMHVSRDELRGETRGIRDELVGRVDACRTELREDMASMHHELAKLILASQAQTLSLHEDLVERIKVLGEGLNASTAPPLSSDGA